MAIKISDVLTQEVVRDRLEDVAQETLQFRRAFKDLPAMDITDSSIEVPKPDDTIGKPEAIRPGQEFPRDEEDYSKVTINFTKYGFEVPIEREAQQDAMFDIAADQIERQGRQMAEKLNDVAFTELNGNLNTDSPAGGLSDASSLGFNDLVDGRRILREDGYNPDFIIVNTQGEADLLNSTEFQRATAHGDRTIEQGQLGTILNMPVFSENSGNMASGDGEAYMVDTSFYGYEATKEPIMTEEYDDPSRQTDVMQIWTRKGFKAIDSGAAIKVES